MSNHECRVPNDLTLHFGLGNHDKPVTLEIRWPGAAKQQLQTPVDRTVTGTFTPDKSQ